MTKIELEELFKRIESEICQSAIWEKEEAINSIQQQYYLGRRHGLEEIKSQISYMFKHLLEAQS